MRITSTAYSDLVINSSQTAQQRQAQLEQQISSGNRIQDPSDDPIAYGQAARTQLSLSRLDAYSQAITQATSLTTQNNQAMTSLHQVVAQAGELIAGVNNTMSAADMKAYGTQMSSLLSQLTSIANQKSTDGNYLFGGTSNQPPLDSTTQAYNPATNNQGATINVQDKSPVEVGLLAGRPGTPPVSGFLYDASSGIDIIATLQSTVADLNSGNITSLQSTDLPALNKALDHLSLYVGSSAADMSAVQTAGQFIQQQSATGQQQLSSLTGTSMANALVQLQQTQTQYQASLQAGARILSMSMLNYMGSIPTT